MSRCWGHDAAKDFKPISLTSFSLKTIEHIFDLEVRTNLPYAVSSYQHAYCRGRSTDTALHAVVSTVKNFFNNKQFTLATFLNIEGAFKNVSIESIERAIVDSRRDRSITRCIMAVLWTSSISVELYLEPACGGSPHHSTNQPTEQVHWGQSNIKNQIKFP